MVPILWIQTENKAEKPEIQGQVKGAKGKGDRTNIGRCSNSLIFQ
jgi:hypothetical protein